MSPGGHRTPRGARSNACLSRRDAEPANVGYAVRLRASGEQAGPKRDRLWGSADRLPTDQPHSHQHGGERDPNAAQDGHQERSNHLPVLRAVDRGVGCHAACREAGGMVQEANALGNARDTQTWTTAVGEECTRHEHDEDAVGGPASV